MIHAQRFLEPGGRFIVHEIHLEDLDPVDRIGRQKVDSGHHRSGRAAAYDLAPTARGYPEIDDGFHPLQQAELLVQFEQFVSGTASIAFRLGLSDIRIVKLPLEPTGRTYLSSLGGLQPLLRTRSSAAHNTYPSRAIKVRRIPSRMPRSAMPRVSAGHMSRIASR